MLVKLSSCFFSTVCNQLCPFLTENETMLGLALVDIDRPLCVVVKDIVVGAEKRSKRYNELAPESPAICLPHQDGGILLSTFANVTTSKLAGLFSTLSLYCWASSREAKDTNFRVICLTRIGIKPKSTASEPDALTTWLSELLKIQHSFQLLATAGRFCVAQALSRGVRPRHSLRASASKR